MLHLNSKQACTQPHSLHPWADAHCSHTQQQHTAAMRLDTDCHCLYHHHPTCYAASNSLCKPRTPTNRPAAPLSQVCCLGETTYRLAVDTMRFTPTPSSTTTRPAHAKRPFVPSEYDSPLCDQMSGV